MTKHRETTLTEIMPTVIARVRREMDRLTDERIERRVADILEVDRQEQLQKLEQGQVTLFRITGRL